MRMATAHEPRSLFDAAIVRRGGRRQLHASSTRARMVAQPGDVRRRGRQRAHHDPVLHATSARRRRARTCFTGLVASWLWFTVLFANFAEAMAEGRGKAQADTLRKTRAETIAPASGAPTAPIEERRRAAARRSATTCVVAAGEVIPGDGEVIEGIASVDESAITGESAPVIRESGGDRSRGHRRHARAVRPDRRARSPPSRARRFLDRMIALVEGADAAEDAERDRAQHPARRADDHLPARGRDAAAVRDLLAAPSSRSIVLVALLVCLIPTTIGALLSAIGIAGMDRLVQRNVLAMRGRAVEAAGDVDTLLLDKTGTITLGNRQAAEFLPAPGVDERRARRRRAARRASPTRRPRAARSSCWPRSSYGLRERDAAPSADARRRSPRRPG